MTYLLLYNKNKFMRKEKYTDEVLKQLAEKKNGHKYDYSKLIGNTRVRNGRKEILVICPKHGEFYQNAYQHIFRGDGCKKCKYDKMSQNRRCNENDFIDKCKEKFSHKNFVYDEVIYENNRNKVKIICKEKFPNGKEHGVFEITPSQMLKVEEPCPYCSRNGKKDFNYFVNMCEHVHQNDYDYSISETSFKNFKTKIPILCKKADNEGNIHGVFYQTPSAHLLGQGCPKCANEKRIDKNTLTHEEFIKKVLKIYGNELYDLDKIRYIDSKHYINIICKKHGEFKKMPSMFLLGQGCPKCANEKRIDKNTLTHEEFIKRLPLPIKENIDIITQYIKSKKEIIVKCKTCNYEWLTTPNKLISGCGCPVCNRSGGKVENNLFKRIKAVFPDAIHLYYNKDILGKQSLDIFIPSLNIAIEYQGEQHFIAIDHFGGTEGLIKTIERDKRKFDICNKNNIKLYYMVPLKYYHTNGIYNKQNTYMRIDRLINALKRQKNNKF